MDRLERIHTIDRMLRTDFVVSTSRFCETLEVSLSTLKRDLEYMRDRLNAPIVWDRDANGYRLDVGNAVGPKYELPGLWFNDDEIYALLTMQSFLDGLQPGLLGPHLKPLQAKLEAILASTKVEVTEIARRIRILAARRRSMPVKHFQTIASATTKRRQIQIMHFSRTKGERSTRVVSPQQLVYYRDNWYLDCWCHMREAVRTFSVDAIEQANILDEPAMELSLKTLREALSAGYGIFAGQPTEVAKIRVGPVRARWIKPTTWHAAQKSYVEPTGHYLLEIPYSDDRELLSEILSLLPDVEVIEPSSLRGKLREVLDRSRGALAN